MNERPGVVTIEIVGTLHAVETELEASVEPLGLSLAKLGVLSQLAAAGEPLPLGALAERCACVRSNITQLVDRLETDKLVARADAPRDRRSVRAELTEEGRARYAAGIRALDKAEGAVMARLPRERRDAFLGLLRLLRGE